MANQYYFEWPRCNNVDAPTESLMQWRGRTRTKYNELNEISHIVWLCRAVLKSLPIFKYKYRLQLTKTKLTKNNFFIFENIGKLII